MDKYADNELSGASGTGMGTMAQIKDRVTDKVTQVGEAVSTFGRKAVDGLDAQRGAAAATIDHTASGLHQQTNAVAKAAHATANSLQTAAEYLRKNDMAAMAKDVSSLVRRYPGQALAVAAIGGFLVSRALRTRA